MKISDKFHSLTKRQIIFLVATAWVFVSIVVWFMNPAARKGPLGFGPPASMVTFQMSDDSFSISYPQNWTVFETPNGSHGDQDVVAIILVAGHDLANITVARQSFPTGNIDNVVAWGKSRASTHQDHKSISINPFTDNNLDGYIYEYLWTHDSLVTNTITSICHDIYIFKNNTGYSLSFCSTDKDRLSLENTYEEMWQSFFVK